MKHKISPITPPNPLIFHRGKHGYEFGVSSSKTQPHDVCVLCHSVEIYQSTPPCSPRITCCSLPQSSHYYWTYLMSVFKISPYLSASTYCFGFCVLCTQPSGMHVSVPSRWDPPGTSLWYLGFCFGNKSNVCATYCSYNELDQSQGYIIFYSSSWKRFHILFLLNLLQSIWRWVDTLWMGLGKRQNTAITSYLCSDPNADNIFEYPWYSGPCVWVFIPIASSSPPAFIEFVVCPFSQGKPRRSVLPATSRIEGAENSAVLLLPTWRWMWTPQWILTVSLGLKRGFFFCSSFLPKLKKKKKWISFFSHCRTGKNVRTE